MVSYPLFYFSSHSTWNHKVLLVLSGFFKVQTVSPSSTSLVLAIVSSSQNTVSALPLVSASTQAPHSIPVHSPLAARVIFQKHTPDGVAPALKNLSVSPGDKEGGANVVTWPSGVCMIGLLPSSPSSLRTLHLVTHSKKTHPLPIP